MVGRGGEYNLLVLILNRLGIVIIFIKMLFNEICFFSKIVDTFFGF